MDLARLWADGERAQEGRDLLAGVFANFTEGFETTDLQEAARLLDGAEDAAG
jgi:predicted ATPase